MMDNHTVSEIVRTAKIYNTYIMTDTEDLDQSSDVKDNYVWQLQIGIFRLLVKQICGTSDDHSFIVVHAADNASRKACLPCA
jgi:hypothetical protein